jgi:hypothetical protein
VFGRLESDPRAAGIVAKGTDLNIPVLILKTGEDPSQVKAVPERFTAILVQVKCYGSKIDKAKIVKLTTVKLTRVSQTPTSCHMLACYWDWEGNHRPK